jgi:outer membrane protein OmpA-like peptidoglycan-associated protein
MKLMTYLIIIATAGLLVGCAATLPPTELLEARQAVLQANSGQAAQLVPAEVHKADEALALAEKSFKDDPKSYRTKDLAYVASRKAKLAEALAVTAVENVATAKAKADLEATQAEVVKKTKDNLAIEQKARIEAEAKAAVAQADLAKLAAVKEEARGLVITLSGSVLFTSNTAVLSPAAQTRLNQVADALMMTKERKITVEGHTDSRGSTASNQELSQRRAEAVRSYILSRGYPSDLIVAQGIGEDRPVTDNASAEGRANNRRVEIVVNHGTK